MVTFAPLRSHRVLTASRILCAALLLGLGWTSAQSPATGTLTLGVVDEESGQKVPARVEVRDAGGIAHFANDALLIGSWPRESWNREIGQVEFEGSFEKYKKGLWRKVMLKGWWKDQFYSSGNNVMSLPAGTYDITAIKGIEYTIGRLKATVKAGKTAKVTLRLKRWSNLPKEGWYSSDDHLHIDRRFRERNPTLCQWMQAEDIHVANLLQMGTSRHFNVAVQYAFGKEGRYRDGNTILASGQEQPRTHFIGHAMILGGKTPILGSENYLVYRDFFEEAEAQGALSGFAHFGVWKGAEDGISLALTQGALDFIEVLQMDRAMYWPWYDILNTGFRVAPTAGSDYMGYWRLAGLERFYTRVDPPFTFERWIDGIQKGRTFVTNGPIVEFSVNGRGIGDEVRLDAPGFVKIEGSVRFDPERDDVRRLEVIENGRVIRTFERGADASEIRCRFEHSVGDPVWLALRASGTKVHRTFQYYGTSGAVKKAPSHAHTGATYVILRNKPGLAEQPLAKQMIRRWLGRLEWLEERLEPIQYPRLAQDEPGEGVPLGIIKKNREALLKLIAQAQGEFEARLHEGERTIREKKE